MFGNQPFSPAMPRRQSASLAPSISPTHLHQLFSPTTDSSAKKNSGNTPWTISPTCYPASRRVRTSRSLQLRIANTRKSSGRFLMQAAGPSWAVTTSLECARLKMPINHLAVPRTLSSRTSTLRMASDSSPTGTARTAPGWSSGKSWSIKTTTTGRPRTFQLRVPFSPSLAACPRKYGNSKPPSSRQSWLPFTGSRSSATPIFAHGWRNTA